VKQVIQNFKTGELNVETVPMPSLSEGVVLVENKYSLISAGTEKETVSIGKASMLGKAQKRPDLVEQVFQNIKNEGLEATFFRMYFLQYGRQKMPVICLKVLKILKPEYIF